MWLRPTSLNYISKLEASWEIFLFLTHFSLILAQRLILAISIPPENVRKPKPGVIENEAILGDNGLDKILD